jgi:hypothetical protein
MTTAEDLKPTVTIIDTFSFELASEIEEILGNGGEVLSVLPGDDASKYRIVAKFPKKIPHVLLYNIHTLIAAIRAVPKDPPRNAEFTPRKPLTNETIELRDKLADALQPATPAHHLIPVTEMALILLRAYQIGRETPTGPTPC